MTPHPLKMSDVNVGMRLRDPDDRRFKQEGVLTVTALTEIGFSYDAERDTFIGARHGVLLAKNRQHFGSDGMCRFILLSKPQLAAMTLAPVTHYRIEIGNGTIYASRDPLGPYCLAADVDALLAEKQADGAVTLSAEDARVLAFLLARAIQEDVDASDGDRKEARRLLTMLGGDVQ